MKIIQETVFLSDLQEGWQFIASDTLLTVIAQPSTTDGETVVLTQSSIGTNYTIIGTMYEEVKLHRAPNRIVDRHS